VAKRTTEALDELLLFGFGRSTSIVDHPAQAIHVSLRVPLSSRIAEVPGPSRVEEIPGADGVGTPPLVS
jgi:hypothetical protein